MRAQKSTYDKNKKGKETTKIIVKQVGFCFECEGMFDFMPHHLTCYWKEQNSLSLYICTLYHISIFNLMASVHIGKDVLEYAKLSVVAGVDCHNYH